MCRVHYYSKTGNIVPRDCKLHKISLTDSSPKQQIDFLTNSDFLKSEILAQESLEIKVKNLFCQYDDYDGEKP